MTGTNRSNTKLAGTAVLALLVGMAPLQLLADDLILEGKERLSGKVRAINPDGTVVLDTPLAPEAVELKGDSVKKVEFSVKPEPPAATSCQVTLANGDVLPAVVGSIDDKNVTLTSSVAGPLVIPRAMVSALRIGANHPNVIFAGPDGLGGWTRDKATAEQWSFDKGALRVQGSGSIGRTVELPQDFIVRFKLAWTNNPNFRFFFAGPAAAEGGGAVDQYFFQFNPAGIEIKREASSGRRYPPSIAQLSRLPQQFPGKRLTVEIRVDRSGRMLYLFLNDEPEGQRAFKDPLPKAPVGNRIAFESMADEGSDLSISDIQVSDWNLKNDRRPADDRGDKTKDALIGVEAERFSGNLMATKPSPEGLLYVFKSAFQENAIEVPEAAVATLYFAEPEGEQAAAVPSPFSLQFQGGGSLRVSACSFSESEVAATHPLLGPLKLQRDRVTAFERIPSKPQVEKKES
jgi:hypothetical protein